MQPTVPVDVLARARAAAEALMVDTCQIVDRTGQSTDPLTGAVTVATAPTYTGKCKVQSAGGGSMGRRQEAPEVAVVVLRLYLHLPVLGSENVGRGQEVRLTASVFDPGLVGRLFRVHDLMHKSFDSARRLLLEEIT